MQALNAFRPIRVVKLNEDFRFDEKAKGKYRYLRASILPE